MKGFGNMLPVLKLMASETSVVVSKAVLSAAKILGLTNAKLAEILGVSAPTITRLSQSQLQFSEASKEFEHATLLLRAYTALLDLVGHEQRARAWLMAENLALGARPLELMVTSEGLVRVVGYLESASSR